MFGLIKQIFVMLLTSIVNASNHTKYMSLWLNLLLLNYILVNTVKNWHYYLFAVNLGRCTWIFNTPDDLFNKVCVPNEIEHVSATCSCKSGKYAGSITNNLVVMFNEIVYKQKVLQQKLFEQVLLQQILFKQKVLQQKLL